MKRLRRIAERLVHRIAPVWWANFGPLSQALARWLPMQQPPVLLVSFPRSGSSWLGRLLSYSANACYLREPITQARRRWYPDALHAVTDVGINQAPRHYTRYANRAFAGCPAFSYATVLDPGDWALSHRSTRRVLIKEVNPFAVGWMRTRYAPTVIHLMRHPVAVAQSMHQRGWTTQRLHDYLSPERLAQSPLDPESLPDSFWPQIGAVQGLAHHAVRAACPADVYTPVHYETLCTDPVGTVRRLCRAVGLTWHGAMPAAIQSHSTAPDVDSDPYATTRRSASQATAWKDAPPEQIQSVQTGYMATEPEVYVEKWEE